MPLINAGGGASIGQAPTARVTQACAALANISSRATARLAQAVDTQPALAAELVSVCVALPDAVSNGGAEQKQKEPFSGTPVSSSERHPPICHDRLGTSVRELNGRGGALSFRRGVERRVLCRCRPWRVQAARGGAICSVWCSGAGAGVGEMLVRSVRLCTLHGLWSGTLATPSCPLSESESESEYVCPPLYCTVLLD